MAVTQYIGSRYVPLFAEPIEWSSTKTYEALTIVYHEGNSYTSKQAVPVGIDISNTAYWALTGNYNAQIEQYRSEVQGFADDIEANKTGLQEANAAIQENKTGLQEANAAISENAAAIASNARSIQTNAGEIEALNEKVDALELTEQNFPDEFACIGDSYLDGYAASGTHTGWGDMIASYTGKTGYIYSQGGLGYDANALAKLNQCLSEHPSIPLVIIGLGVNNRTTTFNSIVDSVKSMLDVMVEHPNTKFHFFPCLVTGPHIGTGLLNVEKAVNQALAAHENPGNIAITNNCWTWIIDDDDYFDHSDQLHPTQKGQNGIASAMICALKGGDPTIACAQVDFTSSAVCQVTRIWNCIAFAVNGANATDGNAFLTIDNGCLNLATGYGTALEGSGGAVKNFNTNGYALKAAYGNMNKGYLTFTCQLADKR